MNSVVKGVIRKTGIDIIGDKPWGTHLCLFYQTPGDLIDILAPYFRAGLENNEFCLWVASEAVSEKGAKQALGKAVPDFDEYLNKKQIEIIPHSEWYLKDGAFDIRRVLNAWLEKLEQALSRGYDGLRVTGNTAWLEKKDWGNLIDYEEEINKAIGEYRMLAICTYSLDKCGAADIIDVVGSHQSALIRQEGKWRLIESSERKMAEEELQSAYRELKETQEELIQTAKMAAMGELAAGISHELNQPLTGVKGFTQAILNEIDKASPLRKDLNKIEEQADRMDKIIQNVRLYARKSEFKQQELDINQPIEDSFVLLNKQLKVRNIRVRKILTKNLPPIKGDANQLQQVFLNLITNAKDSIDSLKRPDEGELLIQSTLSENKKDIEIAFKDTGCGISEENLQNIFDPFFTTKSPQGGLGLGLSIAYRIIENHQGRIEVESAEGKGTTFKITLPVIQGDKR